VRTNVVTPVRIADTRAVHRSRNLSSTRQVRRQVAVRHTCRHTQETTIEVKRNPYFRERPWRYGPATKLRRQLSSLSASLELFCCYKNSKDTYRHHKSVPGNHPGIPDFRPYPPALQLTFRNICTCCWEATGKQTTKQPLLDNIIGAITRQRTTNQWKNFSKRFFSAVRVDDT
jgi:hypothetical protein